MKINSTIAIIIAILCFEISVGAITPTGFNYQGVARNSDGSPIADNELIIKIQIIADSINSVPIYTEYHTVTTNRYGVFSIVIGSKSKFNDNFQMLKWGTTNYYISVAIQSTDNHNQYNELGTFQLQSVPYAMHALEAENLSGHYIGEVFGGGVVFFVYNNGKNGLIVSPKDIDGIDGVVWSNSLVEVSGLNNALSLYEGVENQMAILNNTKNEINAAKLCADYVNGNYDDWYLPSIWELSLLYHSAFLVNMTLKNVIDGANTLAKSDNSFYWSSTSFTSKMAIGFNFAGGFQDYDVKNNKNKIRAIRAF